MATLLRQTPLRVKLVAAVLALAAIAVLVISVASTLALRSYLTHRIDSQLHVVSRQLVELGRVPQIGELPSTYIVAVQDRQGTTRISWYYPVTEQDLPPMPTGLAEVAELTGAPYTDSAPEGDMRWRLLVTSTSDGLTLIVGQSMADVDHAVSRLIWAEALVGAAVLILVGGIGTGIVRKSLQPLDQIERTAGAIAAGDLTQRVPDPEPSEAPPQTELGRLGRALNTMLAQIEAAFTARTESEAAARDAALASQASEARARRSEERMRQFVADASHELRTPLTTIRGFAELYRQGAVSSPAEAGKLVRRIEDEASRMGLLVQDLLLLARLDRERPLELAPVELPVIAADAVQAARAMDPDRPIELAVERDGRPLVVAGDDARLRQVVGNLVTNALTHTPAGTPVLVRLRTDQDDQVPQAVIEVIDQGPGLDSTQAERVFERFYRVDMARTRPAGTAAGAARGESAGGSQGGTGLGLAIVAALAAAHHGTVAVDSTPGQGATFRVRLPLAPADATTELTVDSQKSPSPVPE